MTSANEKNSAALGRYVPLLIWIGCVCSLLYVPLKVIGLGFLPSDDALRHVAKVISGKSWQDIIVLREGLTIDLHAGWHALLGIVYHATNWPADALVTLSVVSLASLFLIAPLCFTRRPEAWVAAFLAILLAYPQFIYRIMLGRPFIFVMAVVMVMLVQWRKSEFKPGGRLLAISTLLYAFISWVHGGWYLYWLPAAGLLAAQRWRAGALMAGCWLVGSFLGGVATGHPILFLSEQASFLAQCFSGFSAQRMLVTEFTPTDGQLLLVIVAALAVFARRFRGESIRSLARDPIFMMAVVCWVLGLGVRRFSLDWGIPALLVWLTGEAQILLAKLSDEESMDRLAAAGLLCIAVALFATSDLENRWTRDLTKEFLSPETPGIEGWLPEPGGLVYADSTYIFFDTFYKNPHAPWKYVVGFESSSIPDEDLQVFRSIQWNYGTPESYAPWVKKMKPADRLILKRAGTAPPDIPGLEWHFGATETWIGRTPRGS